MNKEEIKELAREEFINNVMTNLDSSLIFTYISNLEQENKQLKADYGTKAQVERDLLQMRIDKAIEYIEADYINGEIDGLSWLEVHKLLEILKGDSNES